MRNDFNRPLQRVLMVLPYANWAGTERHVLILGSELLARGWDVTVLSPPGPAQQWWRDAQLKMETFAPPAEGIRHMVSSLRQQANAWVTRGRNIGGAQVKAGIVHVHGAPELLFLLRHLRPTAGMVFTSHGFVGHNVRWDYWWAAQAGRRWADMVIAVSRPEAARLLCHGLPSSHVKVIRNGIGIPSSRSVVIRTDGCPEHRPGERYGQAVWSIGFVGRLTPQKGLEHLLRALPLTVAQLRAMPPDLLRARHLEHPRHLPHVPHALGELPAPETELEAKAKAEAEAEAKARAKAEAEAEVGPEAEPEPEAEAEAEPSTPRIKLWVVGDGPEKPRLTGLARQLTMIEPGLAVEFVGAVADVTPWWQQFDIFVLPSRNESFGLVIAEAMAAGVPVIASHLPATAETIRDGETGLLVPPADPVALASAMVRLIVDGELRQRLAEQARRYAYAHLSAASMAAQTESLYLQLLTPTPAT